MMNLKVGDRVGVARWNRSYGGFLSERFGVVTKINGHGHIFVGVNGDSDSELKFDKHGDQYKKNGFGLSLVDADRLQKSIDEDNSRKAVASVVRKIEETIKEGWSHSGTWHKSDDRIEQLKSLVDLLAEA